ncbi:MAG: helix-turn-helix domain-containing protein [Henriciella sp.]|uniref:TetR/AcrR family transcriptional regulator n=1 Tax=Henriciella sp. TaxID=1968823 RepID=UPI003C719064
MYHHTYLHERGFLICQRDGGWLSITDPIKLLWNIHSKKQYRIVRLLWKACRDACYRSKVARILSTKRAVNSLEIRMVRPRSKSRDELVLSAMWAFWKNGFASTSVEDLVASTGVGRGGIYTDFGGKEQLFLGCLAAYREKYVDPALALLLSGEDGLSGIEAYFDHFIELHKQHGMPGPGCFLANVMTECAPHDEAVRTLVNQHERDLRAGFLNALERSAVDSAAKLSNREVDELAGFLATASQGLWSYGRSIDDVGELERFKTTLMKLLSARLALI